MDYKLPVPKQKSVYEWSYQVKADPNKVGAEIEEIAEENEGQVTPRDLVEKASNRKSEMHVLFEWNNDKAAEKYRDTQAQYILRNLRIRVVESQAAETGPKEFVLRSMINVKVLEERFYSPLSVVLRDDEQRQYALKDLRDSLMAWRSKSAMFTEFAGIHAAIDRLFSDTLDKPEVLCAAAKDLP